MPDMKESKTVLSYKDLIEMGFSRAMAYRILADPNAPVVEIGRRRFILASKFDAWLETHLINK